MPNWKSYESSVRLLSAIIAAHPGLKLNYDEVARCYGKSVNGKAIRNFYDRTIKHDVKAVLDTLEAGGDPEDLQLSGIAKIGGGTKAIAGQFGDGVTENGSAKKTPVKRATPAKRKAAAVKGEDGDDDEMAETPSKKAKGPRAKATPRGGSKKAVNYQETSDVDDEEGMGGPVKAEKVVEYEEDIGAPEYGNPQYASNGNGNGNGYYASHSNGNGNGHTMTHDNGGYEDDEDNFAGQDMYFEASDEV